MSAHGGGDGTRPDGSMSRLGPAALTADEFTALVCSVTGEQVVVQDWTTTEVSVNAIGTEAVWHVDGIATASGTTVPWAVLVKILRSPRHWPGVETVPTPVRQDFIDSFPWRAEVDLLAAGFAECMPPEMRTPQVYRCDDLGDDRIVLWMEWVPVTTVPWGEATFRRAARALGRLAARGQSFASLPPPAEDGRTQLRRIVTGPLAMYVVPQLADARVRDHPMLQSAGPLLDDLLVLADRVLPILDRFESLPHGFGHGDACPQNLLVPAAAPDTFVAIDLSWPHSEAIGFDLGQLLVGLAHAGELAASDLPGLHDVLVDAFVDGLRVEGCDVAPADVRYAFDAAMVIRSAFQSLPWESLGAPLTPDLVEHFRRRVELTRYLADVGLALDPPRLG